MKRHLKWAPALAAALLVGAGGAAFAQETASLSDQIAAVDAKYSAATQYIWVLVAGFLVMFMQAGFAMVETGFCRAKNATNLMAKNLMDFVMGSLVFFAVGYALMKGTDVGGIFGTGPLFLSGEYATADKQLDFFWQLVFCATAATIVSGAVAERLKFSAYLVYSFVICIFVYPLYGHWVWGGGWLSQLGHVDFAGSGVVHAVGGWFALGAAIVLGPRYGKFAKDGTPRAIPGHSMTLAALGTFILWFGWFGFNPGSTFSGTDSRSALIAVNTNMAAAAGALTALMIVWAKTKRFDVGMGLNGALAGLVAITAPCAYVTGWASVLIGVIGGILVVAGVFGIERLGIDDPVGAVSVHGINGVWGLVSLGIFANGEYGDITGALYGGKQLVPQLVGAGTVMAWGLICGLVVFKAIDLVMGVRVSAEEEIKGLDIQEHGTPAYPEFYQLRS
jgi:Amt family ammonium transporter